MNIFYKLLLTTLIAVSGFAEVDSKHLHLSANSWELHKEGLSLALTLTTRSVNGVKGDFITIYVTNTSNTVKTCIIDSSDTGFQIFTLSNKGEWSSLRNYSPTVISMAAPIPIDPGQTRSHIIDLSSSELAIIRAHPVKCRVAMVDQKTGLRFNIESSPRKLTETLEGVPSN